MTSILVTDFRFGLDRRKSSVTSPSGTLRELKNAHITRGGEIEKSKKFDVRYTLPVGTFSVEPLDNNLYVFGSIADPAVPAGVTYQRLQHPDGVSSMTKVIDADVYDSKLYVVAEFDGGDAFHYYDGSLVSDWSAGLVRDDMTNTDGIAAHISSLINADSSVVSSSSVGSTITITALAQNVEFSVFTSAVNGGATDDQTALHVVTIPHAPSVAQVSEVTIGGTFEAGDSFTVYIDDYPYGRETRPTNSNAHFIPFNKKIYFGAGKTLFFTAVDQPTKASSEDAGAGFITMDKESKNFKNVTGLANYFDNLAVFSEKAIIIWSMTADDASNQIVQKISSTGVSSHKTIEGDTDNVRYLARQGFRSLRPRDSSNFGEAKEMGSPIDDDVTTLTTAMTSEARSLIPSVTEPLTNRYITAIGGVLFVFSEWVGAKISAWSRYEQGISFTDMIATDDDIFAREGDIIYQLGGEDGDVYVDGDECVIRTPFMDGGNPASEKTFGSIDVALEGLWSIEMATDPTQPDAFEIVGRPYQTTYAQQKFAIQGESTHISLRFTSLDNNYGKIGNVMIHYEAEEAD